MKSVRFHLLQLVAVSVALGLVGCGEKQAEPAVTPPAAVALPVASTRPPEPPKISAEAANPAVVAPPAQALAAPVKPPEPPRTAAQEAAKVAQNLASDAGSAAQKQFTDLVTDVKQLVADGKASEAITRLQTALANLKLSADQQRIVDTLKKQAQDAVTQKGVDAATRVVGDLFKPKVPAPAAPQQ